jgi:hypothetical protein
VLPRALSPFSFSSKTVSSLFFCSISPNYVFLISRIKCRGRGRPPLVENRSEGKHPGEKLGMHCFVDFPVCVMLRRRMRASSHPVATSCTVSAKAGPWRCAGPSFITDPRHSWSQPSQTFQKHQTRTFDGIGSCLRDIFRKPRTHSFEWKLN